MEIEGLIIPQKWCDALAECQLKDPTAIIAGGCLRDLYFGREPKDVDIFTGQLPDWPLLDESSFDYEGMQYVLGVADYKRDDIKYNVIIVEPVAPNILIETFDLGFCQIAFDGKSLIKSQAFLWDAKYQLITLCHTDRYSRSIRRYARINERYNLDLIIPVLEQINAIKLLDNWKYDDVDYGRPADWGPDCILIVDSLSRLCDAAYDFHESIIPRGKSGDYDGRAVYGNAQDDVEKVLAMLTSRGFATKLEGAKS